MSNRITRHTIEMWFTPENAIKGIPLHGNMSNLTLEKEPTVDTIGNRNDALFVKSSRHKARLTLETIHKDDSLYYPLHLGSTGAITLVLDDGQSAVTKGVLSSLSVDVRSMRGGVSVQTFEFECFLEVRWNSYNTIHRYVVRVDMGDGTYREFYMTEDERKQYDPRDFLHRVVLRDNRHIEKWQ